MRRASLVLLALVCAAAAATTSQTPDPVSQRIARIEARLLPGTIVTNAPQPATSIADRMRFYNVPGVSIAVINDGRIEWARGYGVQNLAGAQPVTPHTRFQAGAMSEAVAALAALALVQQGALSLDEDVNAKLKTWQVPENDLTRKERVTLRRLLGHTAGLNGYSALPFARTGPIPTILQILNGTKPASSMAVRVEREPGSQSRPVGADYTIVQQLLVDITGRPFPELMQDLVLRPLGMTDSTYEQPLPQAMRAQAATGHATDGAATKGGDYVYPQSASAGLWTTPSDLARVAIAVQRAAAGQTSVLSTATAREMLALHKGGWGLGLLLEGSGAASRFRHGGANTGFRCQMTAYVDRGLGAVVMTNGENGIRLAQEVLRAVAAEYRWPEYPLPKQKTLSQVDASVIKAYAGMYGAPPGIMLGIQEKGGRLFAITPGHTFELLPESATRFFETDEDGELEFVRDASGAVTHIVVNGLIKVRRVPTAGGTAPISGQAADRPRLVVDVGHSGSIHRVAFSPDGRWFVTAGDDWTAKLWEMETGLEVRTLRHNGAIGAVAFSPDSRSILTGSEDSTAKLWDLETGREIRTLIGHSNGLSAVAFSPDGKHIATGGWDGTARLWDAETGSEIRVLAGRARWHVAAVAFVPGHRQLLVASADGVALWELEQGQQVRAFEGHSGTVTDVAVSADGRRLLTSSEDKTARLWDVQTGRQIRAFAHPAQVTGVAFLPSTGRVLTAAHDGSARIWDADTGKEIRVLQDDTAYVRCVAVSPDGSQIATASAIWDAATGNRVRRLESRPGGAGAVTFSRDGRRLLTTGGSYMRHARLWDLATGRQIRSFEQSYVDGPAVALSSDGRFILAADGVNNAAKLVDADTGRELRTLAGHTAWVTCVALSADARYAVSGSRDKTAKLWDVATGREIRTFAGHADGITSVALSHDGRFVLTGSEDKAARLWDAQTGRELQRFPGHRYWVSAVAFSADARQVLTASWTDTARLWDAGTGRLLRTFSGFMGNLPTSANSAALADDGRWVVTAGTDHTAKLWDAATGREIRSFAGHQDEVSTVAFLPGGQRVITASADQTVRIWNAETGAELCTLVAFEDGASWAVVDSSGRYDASNGGDTEGLHWVIGTTPIALAQLKERYYEPGLLAKAMGFNTEPLRTVERFEAPRLFPAVSVAPLRDGETNLKIHLTNQGGGIGRVRVLVNGKEIAADARGPNPDRDAADATLTVDLAGAAIVRNQANTVKVIAWNGEGYLASRGFEVKWTPAAQPSAPQPELYAIVGGISDYASPDLHLRFAAKDARDIATALELGAKRLFGTEKVHLTVLATPDAAGLEAGTSIAPTRSNFVKAFEAARQARPGDVLVVYLAGHGVALGGDADLYAYLTQEARSAQLTDPALRQAAAITSEELTDWVKRIPALKQVMILDTCAAASAATKLVEVREVSSSQIRAIERLKDRTGFHVLMGSAADAVSYEASQYGQGLLTYALLQGMRGAALREDEYVDVSTLFQYAVDQVPILARNIGGVQRPQVAAPRGASFDVGRLSPEDKPKVPLARVRPLILRPMLLDPGENEDTLNLTVHLRKALDDASYADARGAMRAARPVFVNADDLPGAVRPTGTYTVQGDRVHVTITLRRDGQRVGTVQADGTRADLAALVTRICDAIAETLNAPR